MIPTTDIADHRIQQSDKMRGTTGQTQWKLVLSDAAFLGD